jgi:DNA-binding NtrC family response regulator
VLWSRNQSLTLEDLSLAEPASSAGGENPVAASNGDVAPEPSAAAPGLPASGGDLNQWERSVIELALKEAGGNQTRAAQRLGISRDTLRYRLKKFGLQGG